MNFLFLFLFFSRFFPGRQSSDNLVVTSTYEEVNEIPEYEIYPVKLEGLPDTFSDNLNSIGDYFFVNPVFEIPSFSYVTIDMDLAGMKTALFLRGDLALLFGIKKQSQTSSSDDSPKKRFYKIRVSKFLTENTITFNFFTVRAILFNLFVGLEEIINEYAEYSLINSTGINIDYTMTIADEPNTIFYVFPNDDIEDYEANSYVYDSAKITGLLLSSSIFSDENEQIYYETSSDSGDVYESPLPYLPFFMNCETFGDFIPLGTVFTSKDCDILDVSEVIVVGPFSFGKTPTADQCNNIEISCKVQEVFEETLDAGDRWYTLSKDDELFWIYPEPMSSEAIYNPSLIDTENLVSAVVQNVAETDKFPLKVYLSFYYYQKTATSKQIITAEVEFKGYESLSEEQLAGTEPIEYTVLVSLSAYSHRDLVTQFAFSFTIYLIISLGIGVTSIIMMTIFTGFNFLVAFFLYKKKEYPDPPTFNLMLYIKNTFPPIFLGIGMAMIPSLLYSSLLSLVLGGHLL